MKRAIIAVCLAGLACLTGACRSTAAPTARMSAATSVAAKKTLAKTKTDLERANLKGPVQKVVEETGDYTLVEWQEKPRKNSTTETIYNRNGYRMRSTRYGAEGQAEWAEEYLYNRAGRLTEIRHHSPPSNLKYSATVILYDSNGRRIAEQDKNYDDRMGGRRVFVYDETGAVVGVDELWLDGVSPFRTLLYYSSEGRLVKKLAHGFEAKEQEWLYAYDARGSLVKTIYTLYSGNVAAVREVQVFEGDGLKSYTDRYDSKGRCERFVCKYELDSHGNRVKETTLRLEEQDGKETWEPYGWVCRTITYYPQ